MRACVVLLCLTIAAAAYGGEPLALSIDADRALTGIDGQPILFGLQGEPFGLPLRQFPPSETDVNVNLDVTLLDDLRFESVVFPAGASRTVASLPALSGPPGELRALDVEVSITTTTPRVNVGSPRWVTYALLDLDAILGGATKIIPQDCLPSEENCLACIWCFVARSLNDPTLEEYWCLSHPKSSAKGNSGPPALDFELLRRFRDSVMSQSASGRYYIDRYYQFSLPLARATFRSPTLVWDMFEAHRLWTPAIASVVNGDGSVVIDGDMIAIYREVVDQLVRDPDPSIASFIASEDARLDPASMQGMSAGEFWAAIENADTNGIFSSGFEM